MAPLAAAISTLAPLVFEAPGTSRNSVPARFEIVYLPFAGGVTVEPPIPERFSVCGLPGALSATLRLAVRAPVALGLKITLMVHVPFGASAVLLVQVPPLAMLKSDRLLPVTEMPLRVTVELPVLVAVADIAELALPTVTVPKLRPAEGVRLKPGCVPVPVRPKDCGLLGALSATLMLAVRAPVALGWKITLIVQVPFGASEVLLVQVPPLATLKSDRLLPVTEMPVRVRVEVPVFFTVSDIAELGLPTFTLPKARPALGVKLMPGTVPVPERGTVWGLAGALSPTLRLAENVAADAGVKVTLMVQLPFGASEVLLVHVPVLGMPKSA